MKEGLGNVLKGVRDKKLTKPKELEGCPFWIRLFLEPFYWGINGLFIVQFIRSFFVEDQETLKIFCFPHSREGGSDLFMFSLSGLSAISGFIVSGGHFLILLGVKCIGKCCLFQLSVRTYNAIAMFNVIWIEQVSMTCANPDSGAYILDFKNKKLLSVTTLLSLIVAFLNFGINAAPKSLPSRKCLKTVVKSVDFVLQPFNYVVSLYFWFIKFQSDSVMFWVLLVWWSIRIVHSIITEIQKWCCKSPEEGRETEYQHIEMRANISS